MDYQGGALTVSSVIEQEGRDTKGENSIAHGIERGLVRDHTSGIRLAILPQIGTGWIVGVRPIVRSFGVILVRIDVDALRPVGSHTPRAFLHSPVGLGAQAAHRVLGPGLFANDGAMDGLGFVFRNQGHRNVTLGKRGNQEQRYHRSHYIAIVADGWSEPYDMDRLISRLVTPGTIG